MPDNKCSEPCDGLTRLEQQLQDMREQNGTDHKELRDRLTQLEKEEAVQLVQYKTILDKLEELSRRHDTLCNKLEVLEAKPGKRWESLVEKAIWSVAAAVIAFLLGRAGL